MALTYPYTFATGALVDAAEINANFAAVATLVDTTKIATTQLQAPRALDSFGPINIFGTVSSGTTRTIRFKLPSTTAFVPVQFDIAFQTVSASSPTLALTCTANGGNLLSTTFSTSTAATVSSRTTFAASSVAASSEIIVTLAVTGGDVTDVTAMLHFRASHVA